MRATLRAALEQQGWNELYEAWIPDLGRVNDRGERRSRSPFPDTVDRRASFTVNIVNGLWRCYNSGRDGNYIQFRAIMEASNFEEETSLAVINYADTERRLMVEFGVINAVEPQWIEQCCNAYHFDPTIRLMVERTKPWNAEATRMLGVGWDHESNRVVFPIYDEAGNLLTARLYRSGHDPKFIWFTYPGQESLGGNFLWPARGHHEQAVILVEGEPDVVSLRSFGFAGVTGTVGAGAPVPDGRWYHGKHVWICMDIDERGQEAAAEAGRLMVEHARSVQIINLPAWDGRPEKADISDYIMHLLGLGYEREQVQRAIQDLLNNAILVDPPQLFIDAEAESRSFAQALSSENLNQRIQFTAHVTARSSSRYILPTTYRIICPAEGHNYCNRCPMRTMFHGHGQFHHDPRSANTLKLIQVSEDKQMDVYKELHGIVKQCPDPVAQTIAAVDVESVILNASTQETTSTEDNERQRREGYVILNHGQQIQENQDYDFEGFMYPHPKNQAGVFILDKHEARQSLKDRFKISHSIWSELNNFRPQVGQSVWDKLVEVATDLTDSTTLIFDRLDLHLAYRTVWHSAISFTYAGQVMERGWIEALVIGDTRCGKSAAFRRMAKHYGFGTLIDCKMQSVAGILGSVIQSTSGEYYAVAGVLPQHDGSIVCFDEFHNPHTNGPKVIESLSSTRAEGVVRISKAASAEFKARVRSIWLANPGAGRLMSELSHTGVELIERLIPQPEDIARFDLALAVTQADVSSEVVSSDRRPVDPRYDAKLSRLLLAWTYSRKPEQILFQPEAEAAVVELARAMHRVYDPSIPLVEIADQRQRVAKVAVSVAAQCFSADETGEYLIVTPEHVYAAGQLFTLWYNKPAMGYDLYSRSITMNRRLRNVDEVRFLFEESVKPHGARLAEELLRLDQVSPRTFGTLVPAQNMFSASMIQILYANNCIQLASRGRKEMYEKTPAFTAWLKAYLAEVRCA